MHQATCIEKIRDKSNHIIEYKLINKNRKIITVKSNELKEAIRSEQIEVTNLTLTSDSRLIDKKSDTSSKHVNTSSKPHINTENLLNRVKTLGYIVNTFDTACKHKCYIASSPDNTKHIFIIPDDVKYIYKASVHLVYAAKEKIYSYISNIGGMLKVVGGNGLVSTVFMFSECKAHSIDLSSFNTSNITDMSCMFLECKAQYMDLTSFDTSNVKNMCGMFNKCGTQSIDLTSFNTSNVMDMSHMFMGCKAQSLDLTSFNTSKVTDMQCMFCGCRAQSIDLTSFDTSNVTNMEMMFDRCKAHYIDLSSFDTSKVTNLYAMFRDCKAQINVTDTELKYQLQRDRR